MMLLLLKSLFAVATHEGHLFFSWRRLLQEEHVPQRAHASKRASVAQKQQRAKAHQFGVILHLLHQQLFFEGPFLLYFLLPAVRAVGAGLPSSLYFSMSLYWNYKHRMVSIYQLLDFGRGTLLLHHSDTRSLWLELGISLFELFGWMQPWPGGAITQPCLLSSATLLSLINIKLLSLWVFWWMVCQESDLLNRRTSCKQDLNLHRDF